MAMSRKNYVAVAAAVKTEIENCELSDVGDAQRRAIARVAQRMAEQFKSDNSRFRYDTFYSACGLDEWGIAPQWRDKKNGN